MLDGSLGAWAPLLGETAWHSLTHDPTIRKVSRQHFGSIQSILQQYWTGKQAPESFLEVASYAHTTGYQLQRKYGCHVSLLDISASTLRLGRELAGVTKRPDAVRLIAADFHRLPFENDSFDLVFMSASLHHTWRWQTVLAEVQRVVAPQGLLILNQEPSARSCCFYRFRSNRIDQFTPFEQHLYDVGILRTIAEPFIGSRPETVFGMIENQRIQLSELIEALEGPTEILEKDLSPGATMSHVDQAWVSLAAESPEKTSETIRMHLTGLCQEAESHLDPVSQSLGFSLPRPEEVEEMSLRVSGQLLELTEKESKAESRLALSSIFGAVANFVLRKRGKKQKPATGKLRQSGARKSGRLRSFDRFSREQGSVSSDGSHMPVHDGVLYAFRPEIARLLIQPRSLLPSIQTAPAEAVHKIFDPACWYLHSDEISSLTLFRQPGRMTLPATRGSPLLILRFYGIPAGKNRCSLVSVWRNGTRVFSYQVWQEESFLCAVKLESQGGSRPGEMLIYSISGDGTLLNDNLKVSVAGLYEI